MPPKKCLIKVEQKTNIKRKKRRHIYSLIHFLDAKSWETKQNKNKTTVAVPSPLLYPPKGKFKPKTSSNTTPTIFILSLHFYTQLGHTQINEEI